MLSKKKQFWNVPHQNKSFEFVSRPQTATSSSFGATNTNPKVVFPIEKKYIFNTVAPLKN